MSAPPSGDWWSHQQSVRALEGFQLEGRVAAGGQPGSAQLRWTQSPEGVFDIRVAGPLGSGSLRLRGTSQQVLIEDRNGRRESQDPTAELAALLGAAFPIEALMYWVRGLPLPGTPARYWLDESGRLRDLLQADWTLHYPGYHSGPPSLPRRIELQRAETRVILLIDRWQ